MKLQDKLNLLSDQWSREFPHTPLDSLLMEERHSTSPIQSNNHRDTLAHDIIFLRTLIKENKNEMV